MSDDINKVKSGRLQLQLRHRGRWCVSCELRQAVEVGGGGGRGQGGEIATVKISAGTKRPSLKEFVLRDALGWNSEFQTHEH